MADNHSSSHPLVKLAVVVGAAFLVVAVVMSVFSALIGIGWTIVKIAVLVGVVAGVVHIARRHRQVRSGDQPGMLSK
jgi:uncharacterized membrane protein